MLCPKLPFCLFFNKKISNMPRYIEMLKNTFCKGDHHNCARWQVAEKFPEKKVPEDLLPNDIEYGNKLLNQHDLKQDMNTANAKDVEAHTSDE